MLYNFKILKQIVDGFRKTFNIITRILKRGLHGQNIFILSSKLKIVCEFFLSSNKILSDLLIRS